MTPESVLEAILGAWVSVLLGRRRPARACTNAVRHPPRAGHHLNNLVLIVWRITAFKAARTRNISQHTDWTSVQQAVCHTSTRRRGRTNSRHGSQCLCSLHALRAVKAVRTHVGTCNLRLSLATIRRAPPQARKRTALGALGGAATAEVQQQPSKKRPRKSGMGRKSLGRRVSFAADLEQTHYYEKVGCCASLQLAAQLVVLTPNLRLPPCIASPQNA